MVNIKSLGVIFKSGSSCSALVILIAILLFLMVSDACRCYCQQCDIVFLFD